VEELKEIPIDVILEWDNEKNRKAYSKYKAPIVDFKTTRDFAINAFKSLT
jgi:hypothetical protein